MKVYTKEQVRSLFKERIKEVGNQKEFALKYGLSPAFVSDVCVGNRGITERVLDILGLEVVYRKRTGKTEILAKKK